MSRESKLAQCTKLGITASALIIAFTILNAFHPAILPYNKTIGGRFTIKRGSCRVAVHNEHGYHLDVMAGAVSELQKNGCQVDIYFAGDRFDTKGLLQPVFNGGFFHFSMLKSRAASYSIVLGVTFPSPQAMAYMTAASANASLHQTFVALSHNPDELLTPPVLHFIRTLQNTTHKSIHIAALAPMVSRYTETVLHGQGIVLPGGVPTFVSLPPIGMNTSSLLARLASGEEEPRNLCIQGSFDLARRNYTQVFAAITQLAPFLQQRNEHLLVMGTNVQSKLPPSMQGLAQEMPALNFEAYFFALAKCRALLAAFGDERYYVKKASSTVLIALNLGIPVVAPTRTLAAYSYLPADGLLLYDERQQGSFVGALLAAFNSTTRHRQALAGARQRVADANSRVLSSIISSQH